MNTINNFPEISHLVALLDDPDDEVASVVRERILSMGLPVAGLLRSLFHSSENKTVTCRIESLITDIESDQAFEALIAWRQEKDPDLLKGLCLINRLIRPMVSIEHIFDVIHNVSRDVWMELSDQKTVMEQIHLLNHVFYKRVGFKAEDPFLEELDKALLDKTTETKRANPIVMGLLYTIIAGQAGIPVTAVAFPGGFLPAYLNLEGQVQFYINVCQHGEIFGHQQLITSLRNFGLSIPDNQFAPCDATTLSSIYAESLSFMADNKGDKEMELKTEKVIELLGSKRFLMVEEEDD